MAKAEWPLNNGTIATSINFGVEVVFLIFTIAFFWLNKNSDFILSGQSIEIVNNLLNGNAPVEFLWGLNQVSQHFNTNVLYKQSTKKLRNLFLFLAEFIYLCIKIKDGNLSSCLGDMWHLFCCGLFSIP